MVLLTGLAAWFSAGAFAQTGSYRNTTPGIGYVGSTVCAACHRRIYSTFIKTGMGRSMRPGNDNSLLERLPAPFTVFDPDVGQFFEVSRKEGQLYQSQYAVGHDGKDVFRQTWPLTYVIGSGTNGFGFVVERDSHLFEAPMTYYSKTKTWGLSPGYEFRNYAFTRPILAQCIGCHSGRPQPVDGHVGAYRNPPFSELAVGCENCHGPGQLHVAERSTGRVPPVGDTSIVNPARLTPRLADDICVKCHQGGDVRVVQPGKREGDFRPGTRLDRVLAIFKVPLNRDSPPQSVLVEHYFAMTLSKCFRASSGRLRCITCHSPHSELHGQEATEYYRAKCLGCHTQQSCKLSSEQRLNKNPFDDCAACHMPKRTVTTITHAALTDHSVAAHPGERYPEEAFASSAVGDTGLLHLTGLPNESASSIPSITLLQAYLDLISQKHKDFTPNMNRLLDRLSRSVSNDRIVMAALAKRAISKDTAQGRKAAIVFLSRAILGGSSAPEDFVLLAELYSRVDRHAEAIQVLEKGREANPYFREFYESIAVQQMARGYYGDAIPVIRKGLALFPDDARLRVLLNKVSAATLEGQSTP